MSEPRRLHGARTVIVILLAFVAANWIPATGWGQSPPHVWSQSFGSINNESAEGAAVDDDGNLFVTGSFQKTVDFGGGDLTSAGSNDIFIVKYDPNGAHLWSKRVGGGGQDFGYEIVVDGSGDVFLAGRIGMARDIYIAKHDGVDGDLLWSDVIGGDGTDIGSGIIVDGFGDVVVTGHFSGSVQFAVGNTLTSAGVTDVFTAKFDGGTGAHVWNNRFGGSDLDIAKAIAVDGNSNIVVTGIFRGVASFGGDALTSAGTEDIFVAKYDSSGSHLWSKRFGGTTREESHAVATDNSDNIVVTGGFSGTVDFGGGPLTSAGHTDIFIAKYDSSGSHLWSKRFGDTHDWERGWAVSFDGSGDLVVAGEFWGAVDFGGGPLTSHLLNEYGESDMFIAKFTSGGDHLWSLSYGGIGWDRPAGLAVDGTGDVFIAGSFESAASFGGDVLVPTGAIGDDEILVAKYTLPALSVLDETLFVCPQGDAGTLQLSLDFNDASIDGDIPADSIVLGNPFGGNVKMFGSGPVTADGPATAANGYQTTITQTLIGGCSGDGVVEFPVRVNGRLAGTAFVSVRSADLNASGHVDKLDFSQFANSWEAFAGGATYDTCADLVNDDGMNCVSSFDYFALYVHWQHAAPGLPPSLAFGDLPLPGLPAGDEPMWSVAYVDELRSVDPNPFNSTTTIGFSVAEAAHVDLTIYNVRGEHVRTLVDRFMGRGDHRVVWEGTNSKGNAVASGPYFCKFRVGAFSDTKKLMLIK